MVEKTNNIDDAEIKYKQALKNYHKESNRHVLVLEADVTEEQKRMILHTSNLIRIAGNCLATVMKRNYEQLVRTKRYRNLKSLYKKAKDTDDKKLLASVTAQIQEIQESYNVTWDFCRKEMNKIKDIYHINSIFARSKAEDVWSGIKKCLYGDGNTIHFPETIKCIEDKCLSGSIENVYIPIFLKGILDICAAGTYHPDTNDDKITRLQCGERYLYMPQHLNSLTYAKASNQIQAFFLGNLKSRPEMWSYANTAICRENLALLEYFHFRAEGAKEYIKKFSKGILSRFIQEGDEKQAVEFVKTGFVSQNTLKEMMLRAKENNMVSLQAYILEQLNVDKANLENFRI